MTGAFVSAWSNKFPTGAAALSVGVVPTTAAIPVGLAVVTAVPCSGANVRVEGDIESSIWPESGLPRMDRRTFLGHVGGVAVAVGLAGCGQSSDDTGSYDVGMTTRKFDPVKVEVTPGTTVRWKNTSTHAHTVTAYDDRLPDGVAFWSTAEVGSQAAAEDGWLNGTEGALYQEETYERTFETAGTHNYFCIPHEASGMVGSVVVSEAATTDA